MAESKDLNSLAAEARQLTTALKRNTATMDRFNPIQLKLATSGLVMATLLNAGLAFEASSIFSIVCFTSGALLTVATLPYTIMTLQRAMGLSNSARTQLQDALRSAEKIASSGYVVADKIAGGDTNSVSVQALRDLTDAIVEGKSRLQVA